MGQTNLGYAAMFSSSPDATAPMASRPAMAGSNSRSILSADLKITGDIKSTGAVEILGEVDGTVTVQSLTIGAEGRVSGDVSAGQVEIRGRFDGNVTSEGLTIRAAAQVTADVSYETLVIESGSQVQGRFRKAQA
jgi:cytoskeletal protein CcmA (bactofilin family)